MRFFVTEAGRAIDGFCYPPAPASRLAYVRALVGLFACIYVVVRAPSFASVVRFPAHEFDPVGPIALLAEPLTPTMVYALVGATVLLALPFAIGMKYRLLAPVFAFLLLVVTSYRSSWGMKFHTDNLLTLHVLILAFAPAADTFAWDARRRGGEVRPVEHGRYGWALRVMSVVTVLTYVIAGIAKLRNSGWDWADGEVLRLQIAYDNLRKIELGSVHAPLGAVSVGVPWIFPPLAWATLLLEIGAPIALLHRRLAAFWALGAWAFHLGVVALMMIGFPYPLSGIAYASFFRVERARTWKPLSRWLPNDA